MAAVAFHPIIVMKAINSAPPMAATVPAHVIPPDWPVATNLAVTIERGRDDASVPISVAHVSAVEAAIAPAPAESHRVDESKKLAAASAAKTPPFARTCHASRSPPFAAMSPVSRPFSSLRYRESIVAEMKKQIRRPAQSQPAAEHTRPSTIAAYDPFEDKDRRCRAKPAMSAASTPPMTSRNHALRKKISFSRSPARRFQ